MAIESSTAKVGRAVIDGWDWNWLSCDYQMAFLMGLSEGARPLGLEGKSLRWWNTLRNGRQIGVVSKEDEQCQWFNWWELELPGVEFDMNSKRVLSKGVGYRFHNRRINKDGKWWKSLNVDVRLNTEAMAEGMAMTVEEVLNNSANRVLGFNDFIKKLGRCGWILRKDDKTARWVIVSKQWEKTVAANFLEKSCVECGAVLKSRHKILYFLPKTQKESCVPGRPIQAWPRCKKRYKRAQRALQRETDWNVCSKSVTLMYRELAEGLNSDGSRPTFISGDVKDMYTKLPRQEIIDLVWKKCPDAALDVEAVLLRSGVEWESKMYKMVDGIDMGCVLSPALAQFYLSQKLSGWEKWPGIGHMRAYIDDFGVRLKGNVDPRIVRVVKARIDRAIAPLEMVWDDDCSGCLDVEWSEDVMEQSTWFRDRGREFGLDLTFELPSSTKANTVLQQVERVQERDGYTYGWSECDSGVITRETLMESRSAWIWHVHRVQCGEVVHAEAIGSGLFGPEKVIRLGDAGARFAREMRHCSDDGECPGCKWGFRWAKWVPAECKPEPRMMVWCPKWESRRGKVCLRRISKRVAKLVGKPVVWRWKLTSVKALWVGMIKGKRSRFKLKVADETRGGVEMVKG